MQINHEHILGVKVEEIPVVFDCKYLAKILGCSESTARTVMNQPGFPVLRLSARKHRIYREQFLAWLDRMSNPRSKPTY